MKNKKDLIILFIFIVIMAAGIIGISLYFKNNNTLSNSSSSSTKIESRMSNIEWSSYETYDMDLTESVTITNEGVYNLSGTIKDGSITINTDGNVKLVLNNVTITNSVGAAIYVKNAKNVGIETIEGTINTLEDGTTYTGYGEEDVNGTIYSKDDLILSGSGTLKVISNYEDAIVSKDDLKITSGTYIIDAKDDAIRGKDSLEITGGTFNIVAGGDGLKSTEDADTSKGFILITGGEFNINVTNDGIQAETNISITNGTFNIKTTNTSSDDSAKGIKAENSIVIDGGTFTLNTTDDGLHSNGNVIVNNGEFNITSIDDGLHADVYIEISGGTFDISAHEGIEGTYIKINDGTINIEASDDGINAAKKSDEYTPTVEINGGSITIKMGSGDTDGIDSNGNIYINGGTINITCNSPFDYDGEAKHTGGTIIVNGEETNTITNQMMGGGQMGGNRQDGGQAPTEPKTNAEGQPQQGRQGGPGRR